MPMYEYSCPHCQKTHEIIQKFSDPPEETCPDCGKKGLTKLLSKTSFQLKGTGWYATDYKKSSLKPTSATPEKSEVKSTSSEGSSSTPASTPSEKKKVD